MYCTKCGSQLNEHGICPKCNDKTKILEENMGATAILDSTNPASIENNNSNNSRVQPAPMKKNKKKKKTGLIVAICIMILILIILLAGAGIIFLQMMQPINRFTQEMEQGNIEEALEYIDKINMANAKEVAKAQEVTLVYVEQLKSDYYNEIIDYATVRDIYDTLENKIMNGNAEFIQCRDFVEKINFSRTSYITAVKLQDDGKYAEAIEEYSNVDPEDSYYTIAQNAISDCKNVYLDDVIAQITVYKEEKQYDKAIELIDEALLVVENDATLMSERNICYSNYEEIKVEEAINTVTEITSNTSDITVYVSACDILDDYLIDFPDNQELLSYREHYANTYCEIQLENVINLGKEGEAETAIEILEKMKSLNPTCIDVDALIQEYKGYLPVSLYDIAIYDELYDDEVEVNDHVYTQDTFENQRDDVTRITLYYSPGMNVWNEPERNAYRKYLVNSKYNHFHCVLSYELCEYTKSGGRLYVKADGVVIYESDIISNSTEPLEIDVDFEDAQYITLQFRSVGMGDVPWDGFARINILMDEAEFSYIPK